MTDKFALSAEYMSDYSIPSYANKTEVEGQGMLYPDNSFECLKTNTPTVCPTAQYHRTSLPNTRTSPHPLSYPSDSSPETPLSFLTSCCTSPTPAPLTMVLSNPTSLPIGFSSQLLPCSPTSNASPSPHVQRPSFSLGDSINLPNSFFPEFFQYSKETYEQSTGFQRKKRRCHPSNSPSQLALEMSKNEWDPQENKAINSSIDPPNSCALSNAELRRQIHIQSEQKRRAQIKDGFEDLRNELPACVNKKMSKVALLHRTVQHIQHLKSMQMAILAELESLMAENEQLRKFRESMLQKQALEKMYQINTL
ncbi:hypothetical protein CLU79DRAFT_210234 [Phycomyces nitens]|nr:hypothetical protein CLU79DRAFT_210234 [Phycomyces nitens]